MALLREDVFLVAPLRTPIGKFGGTLSSLTAVEIGTHIVRATLERAAIDPNAVAMIVERV